jgi:hypothetical protein
MDEVEAFWKVGTYLPKKVESLLSGWGGLLDRARNDEDERDDNRGHSKI